MRLRVEPLLKTKVLSSNLNSKYFFHVRALKHEALVTIMRRSVRSFNIPPRHLNFSSLVWSNSRALSSGEGIVFKCPTKFFLKGKISDRGFLTIDQSLKPGLWRSFPQNHSFELFTFITSISPYLKIYYLNSAGIT